MNRIWAHFSAGLTMVLLILGIPAMAAAKEETTDPHFAKALEFYQTQSYPEAMAELKKAIEKKPHFLEARTGLGKLYIRQGLYNEAIEQCKAVLQIDPRNADAFHIMGAAFMCAKSEEPAIAAFEKAIEIDPGMGRSHFNLGLLYLGKGQIIEATHEFRKAIDLSREDRILFDTIVEEYQKAQKAKPDDQDLHYGLAVIFKEGNLVNRSIGEFKKAGEINPSFKQAFLSIGLEYSQQQRYDEAIEALKKAIAAAPDYSPAHYKLAETYEEKGMVAEAIAECVECLKQDSLDGKWHLLLGTCYLKSGLYDKAAENFKLCLKLMRKKDMAEGLDYKERMVQGIIGMNVKSLGSLGPLEKKMNANAGNKRLADKLVTAYSKTTLMDDNLWQEKAIGIYETLAKIAPAAEVFCSLGVLFHKVNRTDDAVASFRKAIEANPCYSDAHKNLAFLYKDQLEFDHAIHHLRKVVSLAPREIENRMSLAKSYYHSYNLEEALVELKGILKIDKGNEEAAELLEKAQIELGLIKRFVERDLGLFILMTHPKAPSADPETLIRQFSEAYSELADVFKFKPKGKIRVFILPIEEKSGSKEDVLPSTDLAGGIKGNANTMYLREDKDFLMRFYHELVHVFIFNLTHAKCPPWLNEGAAYWLSFRKYPDTEDARATKNQMASMAQSFFPFELNLSAIPQSWDSQSPEEVKNILTSIFAFEYLTKRFGLGKFVEILNRIREGKEADQAFRSALGISFTLFSDDLTEELYNQK
jgi:tetratricopeptide (TPR) repeat protein